MSKTPKNQIVGKIVVRRVSERRFAELVGVSVQRLRYWKGQLGDGMPPTTQDHPVAVLLWRQALRANCPLFQDPGDVTYEWEAAQ